MGMPQRKPKLDPLPNTYMISNLKVFLSHMRNGGSWNEVWDEVRLSRAISAMENARTLIEEMEAHIAAVEAEVSELREKLEEVNVECQSIATPSSMASAAR